jgi:hypothetical protein
MTAKLGEALLFTKLVDRSTINAKLGEILPFTKLASRGTMARASTADSDYRRHKLVKTKSNPRTFTISPPPLFHVGKPVLIPILEGTEVALVTQYVDAPLAFRVTVAIRVKT